MTDLASLLFIAMIPIDCKTNFFLTLICLLFLVTIKILVNSQTPLQKKKNDHEYGDFKGHG